MLFLHWVL